MRSAWREGMRGAACGLILLAAALALPPLPAPAATRSGLPLSSVSAGAVDLTAAVAPPADVVRFVNAQDGWAVVGDATGGPCGEPGIDPTGDRSCVILATMDGGAEWTAADRTPYNLHALDFEDPLHGLAWGQDEILSTSDGGRTWSVSESGQDVPQGLDLVAGETWGVAAGTLVESRDQGRSWSTARTPSGCAFSSVSFPDAADGWAGGVSPSGPCLVRTTDGGGTWSAVFRSLTAPPVADAFAAYEQQALAPTVVPMFLTAAREPSGGTLQVEFTSAADGWIVAGFNLFDPGAFAVLRTTDGGAAWSYAWGTSGCLMGCAGRGEGEGPAYFLNASDAWRWAPSGVAATDDGGAQWTPGGAFCALAQCGSSVSFISGADGWAASPQGIFATTDGGRSWALQWPRPGLTGPVAAVSFVSPAAGFAVGPIGPPHLWRTADAGRSWQPVAAPAGAAGLLGVSFRTSADGCVWSSAAAYCTSDGARSWRALPLPRAAPGAAAGQISDLGFTSARDGWLLDVFGPLWLTTDGGLAWHRASGLPAASIPAAAFRTARTGWALVPNADPRRSPGRSTWSLCRTGDGGRNWVVVAAWSAPAPAQAAVLDGAPAAGLSLAGRRLWLLGSGGVLLRSADGGRSWGEIRSPGLAPLFHSALQFVSAADGWMLTTDGGLLRTTDGGQLWAAEAV